MRKTTTKTLEVIERPFTTEPKGYIKRGCGTIRDRCLRFNAVLRTLYSIEREIPLEKAKEIFQKEMGIWDRTSLKAYFGTQEKISKRKMQRISRYPRTGTTSFKTIELEQPIKKRKGYLEKLGLVSFEKRGQTWFLILRESETVIPVLARNSHQESEREVEAIKDKISLTPISPIPLSPREGMGTVLEVPESNVETENREERESYRVREKFDNCVINGLTGVSKTYPEKNLSPEETRILRAATKEAV